jgi:tetratricopeptide (TPR) repeat protein
LLRLLKNSKEDSNKVKITNTIVALYISNGSYDLALQYANQAKSLAQKISYKRGEANAFNHIGRIFFSKGDYADAIANQFENLKCSDQLKNKTLVANAYNEIATIYDAQGNYEDAIKFYTQSLELRKQLNDKEELAASYNNIGTIYDFEGKFNQALDYYNKGLTINLEIKNNEELAKNYANIGVVYKELTDYNMALEYTDKSIAIDEQYGYTEGACAGLFNLGDIYYLQKNYKLSNQYYDKALKIAKELGLKDYLKEGYLNMTNLDSALGDYKAVYHSYKNFITYRDSLRNEESTKKTLEEQYKYEGEKKEAAIKAEQDKRDAIASEENRRQRLMLWLIAIIATGIGVVALVIYRSLQQNKKAKEIIEIKSKETEEQKHLVEEKQKEILDSITYAKRLQQAILPAREEIKKYLPDSFLYYKPKDIVAGDFYWMEHLDNNTFIAAADSTGHGVPGAMVSIVCSNALNRAVKEFELRDTGKILDKTRELVLETFEKSGEEIKDGMDISLLRIRYQVPGIKADVQWSGANNQLWYIKKEGAEVLEIKADKQPIGQTDHAKPFTTHVLEMEKGDILYLMTDGYPDQFGGEKGKKFKYKQLEVNLLANSTKDLEGQGNSLSYAFDDWKGSLEQVDDVTIIGIKL